MEPMDDMNIEEMINNPFRNIDLTRQKKRAEVAKESFADRAKQIVPVQQKKDEVTEVESERMERNHPQQDRMLTIEKNALITDKRVDTVKRIIEEQNQRIAKLEEELDLLRRHLDANYTPETEENAPDAAENAPDAEDDEINVFTDDDFDSDGAIDIDIDSEDDDS